MKAPISAHFLPLLLACSCLAAETAWKRYTNSALGVSIDKPEDWTVRIGPGQARVDLLDPGYEANRAALTLSSLPIDYGPELFERWKGALRQDDPKVVFLAERDMTLGGARAHEFLFRGLRPGGAQKHRMVFIEGPGKVFSMECSSREEHFAAFDPSCDKAILSFSPETQTAAAGRVTSLDGFFSLQADPGWEDVTQLHKSQAPDTVLSVQSPRGMVNIRRLERGELQPEQIRLLQAEEARGAVDKGAKLLSSQVSVLPNGIELYYSTFLQPSGPQTLLAGIFQVGPRAYRVVGVASGGDPLVPLDIVGGFLKTFRAESAEAVLSPPRWTEPEAARDSRAQAPSEAAAPERPRYKTSTSGIIKFLIAMCMLMALGLGVAAVYSLTRRALEQDKR